MPVARLRDVVGWTAGPQVGTVGGPIGRGRGRPGSPRASGRSSLAPPSKGGGRTLRTWSRRKTCCDDAGDLLAGLGGLAELEADTSARPAEHRVGRGLRRVGGEGDRAPGLPARGAQRDLGERGVGGLAGRYLEVAADDDRHEEAAQDRRLVVHLGGDEVDEDGRPLRVPDQDDRVALGIGEERPPGGQHAAVGDVEGRAHHGLVPGEAFLHALPGLGAVGRRRWRAASPRGSSERPTPSSAR